jgi:hypothetical protein
MASLQAGCTLVLQYRRAAFRHRARRRDAAIRVFTNPKLAEDVAQLDEQRMCVGAWTPEGDIESRSSSIKKRSKSVEILAARSLATFADA